MGTCKLRLLPSDSLRIDTCLHMQRYNELEFAKVWPAIRDFGPYGLAVPADAASSSSETSDPVEQALLGDALDSFPLKDEPQTGTLACTAGRSSHVSILLI